MPLPVLLAVDEDRDALEDVETHLVRRYGRDYRVECLGDPEEALRLLTELAHAGEEVALVLAAKSLWDTAGGELLERVRQLHPHAKRALLVPYGAWTDPPTAEAIRDSLALGRIDYYVLRPAASADEVFHQAISSFLLEWATDRRVVPHTVHIVGDAWSGRALRATEGLSTLRGPARLLPGRLRQGPRAAGQSGLRGEAPAHGASWWPVPG
jgi:thioredoxin reductase (NADPH)